VFLLALSKGAAKQRKGAGKEEFPEHWIFLLLLETPPRRNTKNENPTKLVTDAAFLLMGGLF